MYKLIWKWCCWRWWIIFKGYFQRNRTGIGIWISCQKSPTFKIEHLTRLQTTRICYINYAHVQQVWPESWWIDISENSHNEWAMGIHIYLDVDVVMNHGAMHFHWIPFQCSIECYFINCLNTRQFLVNWSLNFKWNSCEIGGSWRDLYRICIGH